MCCKFCQYGNNNHSNDCPRNEPNAQERWDVGWGDGRRGGEPTNENPAYMAGFRRGEVAFEAWYNGE